VGFRAWKRAKVAEFYEEKALNAILLHLGGDEAPRPIARGDWWGGVILPGAGNPGVVTESHRDSWVAKGVRSSSFSLRRRLRLLTQAKA